MSNLDRLKCSWKKITGFNDYLNSLPISKQARVKVPVGLGLFFLCWLASDQVKVPEYVEPVKPKTIMEAVPFTPPEFVLPKSSELIDGAQK